VIDPKKMTDGDIDVHIRDFIQKSYKEIESYTLVVDEDLLTTGLHRFGIKITQAWGWGHRVMNMLGDGRRLNTIISERLRGKKRLLDEHIFNYKRTHRNTELKGMDAKEREQAALNFLSSYVNGHEKWVVIHDEIRACLETLDAKHKDLKAARSDIRALLGNVKVQGSLGETPVEGEEVGQSGSSGYGNSKVPPPSMTGLEGNVQEERGSDVDVDSLLNGDD